KKTVTLMASGLDFDFGGVAKGYIGDQVIQVLQKNGVEIGCYEAGGDIVLSNPPPGTSGWMIDIGRHDDGTVKTISLANCGISTSGDARQFVEFEGKRYSHVVDPRTGIGVATRQKAFAIAPTGMQSDALATVGCILNETEFRKLLDRYSDTIGWQECDKLD
ncbi:FAD:protein FMN transferase, partial [Mariniblastus sp.]|nr:FAD:protein FMN transferase [Mariniblastus sp.]